MGTKHIAGDAENWFSVDEAVVTTEAGEMIGLFGSYLCFETGSYEWRGEGHDETH
jgi:hypothetical protein